VNQVPQTTRILIVEDETATRSLLSMGLQKAGFQVFMASSGPLALKMAYEHHPEAIILDVMMPGMDGFEVCSRLRQMTDAVIIFVTVKNQPEDIIRGLQLGADDYMTKPYHYKELLARLSACLRRRDSGKPPPVLIGSGDVLLLTDPTRRIVFVDNQSVTLTPKEFDVLSYLIRNRGRVVSPDAILVNVWGSEYAGDRYLVKQFVYRLRSKLEPDPRRPQYLLTVRGSGYVLEMPTPPESTS
jgi:two-component system response regulator RegX3